MSDNRTAQWSHYSDLPDSDKLGDRFTHWWAPSDVFGSQTLSVSVLDMSPGQRGPLHSHGEPIEEYYIVLEGTVDVDIGEERIDATEAGTFFYFPPDVEHRPINASDQPARLVSIRSLSGDEEAMLQSMNVVEAEE